MHALLLAPPPRPVVTQFEPLVIEYTPLSTLWSVYSRPKMNSCFMPAMSWSTNTLVWLAKYSTCCQPWWVPSATVSYTPAGLVAWVVVARALVAT